MLRRWLGQVDRWYSGPAAGLFGLLMLHLALPEVEWVRCLRGTSRIEAELEHAQTRGYYERILEIPNGRRRRAPADEVVPPPGSVTFADSGIVQPDPTYLRWRLKPNLETRWNGTTFRTNRLGYRGPEVAPTKSEGTYRIVIIGSSNTMGHGVDDDATYVRLLERWLNERIGPGGRRVEIVNLAVSGDAPTQQLLRLHQEIEGLDPDWILSDATVLDVSLEEQHLESIVRRDVPIPFPFVRQALLRAGASAADSPDDFHRKVRSVHRDLLEGTYSGWASEARRVGVPLTVVILPRADLKTENPYLLNLIRDLAHRHSLDTLDASSAFADLSVDQFRLSPWDLHPSPLGHLAIFESLRSELDRRGGCPGLGLPGE